MRSQGWQTLLIGEAGDGTPVAVLRGLKYPKAGGTLFMPKSVDIFQKYFKKLGNWVNLAPNFNLS